MKHSPETHTTSPTQAIRKHEVVRRYRNALGMLAGLLLLESPVYAGALQDLYSTTLEHEPLSAAAELQLSAAQQNVITQQRRYLPRISVIAREASIYQDISESGSAVLLQGSNTYEATRVNVEIEQPLYDPTIKPRIEAARARLEKQRFNTSNRIEWQTRLIIERFVNTVRLQTLLRSSERVITRLEKELEDVTKSHEAKIATITDLQNIKLALSGMKRERNSLTQQFNHELAGLGDGGKALLSNNLELAIDANLAQLFPSSGYTSTHRTEAGIVKTEINELHQYSVASSKRSWPMVSLYGQYLLDNATGSVFGSGARDLSGYEVGVSVRWDIFDRGMNRSEARELNYRKRAKEQELQALLEEQRRIDSYSQSNLSQADNGVAELVDLVQQHEILQKASDRAFDAGKETYRNSIAVYLAYEAALRELVAARYDQLLSHVELHAESAGWTSELVAKVDGLFASSTPTH